MEEAGGRYDGEDHQTIGIFYCCFRGISLVFCACFRGIFLWFLQRSFRGLLGDAVPPEMRFFTWRESNSPMNVKCEMIVLK